MKRRLTAILAGDVVGYSAMMEADEEGTAAHIADLTAVMSEKVKTRHGRVFKTMGDCVLAGFASPLNAAHCAIEMRSALAENADQPMQRPQALANGETEIVHGRVAQASSLRLVWIASETLALHLFFIRNAKRR